MERTEPDNQRIPNRTEILLKVSTGTVSKLARTSGVSKKKKFNHVFNNIRPNVLSIGVAHHDDSAGPLSSMDPHCDPGGLPSVKRDGWSSICSSIKTTDVYYVLIY